LRRIALAHQICPYYLGQELLRWSDVMVGDVHHIFDPNGQVWSLAQALDWKIGLLIDEAHNFIDRVRGMYSADLGLSQLRSVLPIAPTSIHTKLNALLRTIDHIAIEQAEQHVALDALPDALVEGLQALTTALVEHFQKLPFAVGPLLNALFQLLRFQRLAESFGDHSIFEVKRSVTLDRSIDVLDADAFEVVLTIRNIVPAPFTRFRFSQFHTATLFSATLGTAAYQRDLLGLPTDTAWIDVAAAFPPENLVVRVADRLSTRFPDRAKSLRALTDLMTLQFDAQPGNYLAFFSSFEYAQQAAQLLAARRPDVAQWRQRKSMDRAARADFLSRFEPQGTGVGFAVLGGVFAEGVDLPGSRLIGAFIATLGLPPVSPVQDQVRARLDKLFGEGHGYADLVPAMQRVVQAAGRVVRTPEDRGWLWLMDDRYRRPEVVQLLPISWGLRENG
ncbi:MAG: helicase C-terminal domain-containing protein, partial [Variovorax sp.]